jgi:hypothetical protein
MVEQMSFAGRSWLGHAVLRTCSAFARKHVIQVMARAAGPARSFGPASTEPTMGKPIPIDLTPSLTVEIDGALVARGLGLAVADFRQLMERRKIAVLCERGTGEDAGLYRASFYYEDRRVRLVVDRDGNPCGP